MPDAARRHDAILTQGTAGSEGSMLARLALPMTVGLAAVIGFNLVDTWFVAMLGMEPLAAMGYTFPVVMIVGNLALGVGVGVTSCVSRAIGAGDRLKVRRLVTDGLLLAIVLVAIVSGIGLATMESLFSALGARDTTLELVLTYMRVYYLGAVFVVVPMVGNAAIRATGDMVVPAVIMAVAGGLNVVFDPILIFGWGAIPAMGIRGAAIASVIARGFTMIISLGILHRREAMIAWRRPHLADLAASWTEILHVAVPAVLTGLLAPITMGAVTAITSRFGTAAVAALGAALRVEGVLLIPLFAVGSVMVPFVGQNVGAGCGDRIRRGMLWACRASLVWGVVVAVAMHIGGSFVAGSFSQRIAVRAATEYYLRVVSLGFGFLGLSFIVTSGLNGAGRPFRATGLMIVRSLGLTIPMAVIGGQVGGYPGLVAGVGFSFVLAGVVSVFVGRDLFVGRL